MQSEYRISHMFLSSPGAEAINSAIYNFNPT